MWGRRAGVGRPVSRTGHRSNGGAKDGACELRAGVSELPVRVCGLCVGRSALRRSGLPERGDDNQWRADLGHRRRPRGRLLGAVGTTAPVGQPSYVRQFQRRVGLGPALWATTNGGASWHAEKTSGPVLDLAAAGSTAYAGTVGSCYHSAPKCSQPTDKVEKTAVGADGWAPVPRTSPSAAASYSPPTEPQSSWPCGLAPEEKPGFGRVPTAPTWRHYAEACYQPSRGQLTCPAWRPGRARSLFELCAGDPVRAKKTSTSSLDQRGRQARCGKLPFGGLTDGFAAASEPGRGGGRGFRATFLYRSANGGRDLVERRPQTFGDGGAGLNDLQFTGDVGGGCQRGVPGLGRPDRLWLTGRRGPLVRLVGF